MKKYSFLFKPAFFIFNLLFATWLVLSIEKLHPSDFGQYRNIFERDFKPTDDNSSKEYLKNLFDNYHKGKIDSTELNKQLNYFLKSISKDPSE
jgi:hypothetical protein